MTLASHQRVTLADALQEVIDRNDLDGRFVKAIETAIDALSWPVGWQDISTARLDGKPFLARYQWLGEHRFMVIRRSLDGPWWIRDDSTQTVGGERSPVKFTHWRPLPAPPETAQAISYKDGTGGAA